MRNVASPSLVRYMLAHDLDMDNSVECFASGVAAYCAAVSWAEEQEQRSLPLPSGAEILSLSPAPSKKALNFSHFFMGLLVSRDLEYGHVCSTAVVLAAAFRRIWSDEDPNSWLYGDWAAELGWCVASESDGSGASWSDNHPPHGLRIPHAGMTDEEFFAKHASA